jgi:hypothetical protein
VTLDPLQKHPIYWLTDEYESKRNCCKVDSEQRLTCVVSFSYGYAVAKDILETERNHATAHLLKGKM